MITLCFALLAFATFSGFARADGDTEDVSSDEVAGGGGENSFIARVDFPTCKLDSIKIFREAESLTGQSLVDYVNRRQNLWTVSVCV